MQLHEEPKPSQTKKWAKRFAMAAIGTACATAVAIGLYGHHSDTFQHDNARFLRELASADGIHITFTPKATANLPEDTTFNAYLIPTSDGNTTQSFTFDGRLSYTFNNQEYNFTMIDNRGYVTVEDLSSREITTNNCLVRDNIPPIHTITESLLTARVVDDAADFDVDCSNGKLVEFTFAGEPYVFCASADKTVNVYGDDLQASVQLLHNNTDGYPTVTDFSRPGGLDLSSCGLLQDTATTSTRTLVQQSLTVSVQRTKDAYSVLTGQPRRSLLADSSCSCSGGAKACLFVHGTGHTGNGTVYDSFSDYWGDIATDAACCSSTKFIKLDTTNLAWFSDTLAQQVCTAALAMVSSTDKLAMEGIALVSHSMGNLIIASAIMKGYCGIDTTASKWISLAGPMQGSMSANLAVDVCGIDSDAALSVLTALGFCPLSVATSALAYDDTADSTAALNDYYAQAAVVYTKYVTSNMCGVSSSGLMEASFTEYVALDVLSKHASDDNDGVVEISSCRDGLSASLYSTSYDGGNYYKASINHKDATFYNGDGWYGSARKPVKWFNCQF